MIILLSDLTVSDSLCPLAPISVPSAVQNKDRLLVFTCKHLAIQLLTGWEPAKDQFPNDPPERALECTESHCASHPPSDVHQSQCKRHKVNRPAVPSLSHNHKSNRS